MVSIFWVDHEVIWHKEGILVLGDPSINSSIYRPLQPHGEGLDVVLWDMAVYVIGCMDEVGIL